MPDANSVIFLNGTYGVGKSATLDHVGDLLAAAKQPFSLMDVDWFHRSWPPAANDPENVLTEAENMSAVWANYRKCGPRQLVVCGVIASRDDHHRFEKTFRMRVRSVRLEASPQVIEARLHSRYTTEQGRSLQWHLERHAALARQFEDADLDEVCIPTDEAAPRAVAEQVLQHFER